MHPDFAVHAYGTLVELSRSFVWWFVLGGVASAAGLRLIARLRALDFIHIIKRSYSRSSTTVRRDASQDTQDHPIYTPAYSPSTYTAHCHTAVYADKTQTMHRASGQPRGYPALRVYCIPNILQLTSYYIEEY